MSSAKEKIKNLKDELGYGAAVTMAVVGGLTGTLKAQAAERTSPQTVNVQEKSVDNGLDRNAAVRDGRSGKTKRVYDWQDVVSKYKLDAKSFENGAKPTKENAAMLSAIIEYEATRPNAVAETYFFRDLSGQQNVSENELATLEQNAKDNAGNVDFENIYQQKLQNMENKQERKLMMNQLKDFTNSNMKNFDFTIEVDKKVVENNSQTEGKTLSFVQAYKMKMMKGNQLG